MIEKRSNNLCDIYILPLVNLNPTSFGIGNFVNSYLDTTDQYVIVKMKQVSNFIKTHSYYRFEFEEGTNQLVAFEVSLEFKPTLKLFREGKYSKFPEDVKSIIRKRSGLIYNVPQSNGKKMTARELLVLDKDPALRKRLEEELSNPSSPVVISPEAELGSIPGEDNFFELHLSSQLMC